MVIKATHEIHRRRLSRNVGVALSLLAFAALMFGLTIAKMQSGASMEGYDHVVRPGIAGDNP